MSSKEDMIIPNNVSRSKLDELFECFCEEDRYDSKQFFKFFRGRRAKLQIPVPSILDFCKNSICYDEQGQIDLRMSIMLVHYNDKKLFVDVANFVLDRFKGKPRSDLTLLQYKTVLARRLGQVGF